MVGSQPTSLVFHFDSLADVQVSFSSQNGAFNQELDLSGLAAGPHTLSATALDLAGNVTTASVNVQLELGIPFVLTAHTPLSGANEVGVTFRPQVFFSTPVDLSSLNENNFFATFAGEKLDARIVPANDGSFAWLFFEEPMPDASMVQVHVDGGTIFSAEDSSALDADNDGESGGMLDFSFSTVSLAGVPDTTLTGLVYDPGPDFQPFTTDDVDPGPDGLFRTADHTGLPIPA